MGIHLNDDELTALAGLPDCQIRLYIFGIRRYMDFSTGIVGIRRRISYQSLSEILYIEPIRGVKTPARLNRSQLRRAVKALERSGLILIKSQGLRLILECLLARRDNFAQNKAVTRPTQLEATNNIRPPTSETTENTRDNVSSKINPDTKAGRVKFSKADTPPGAGITLSNESVIRKSIRSHALPDDFTVKQHHIDLAVKNNWPHPEQELDAFRDHHLAHGSVMKDWDRAFYTWLRNAKRFGAKNYAKNRQFSSRSESILRAYESSAPNINWRGENCAAEVDR